MQNTEGKLVTMEIRCGTHGPSVSYFCQWPADEYGDEPDLVSRLISAPRQIGLTQKNTGSRNLRFHIYYTHAAY